MLDQSTNGTIIDNSNVYLGYFYRNAKHTRFYVIRFAVSSLHLRHLKVQSETLPSARQEHAVAPSGSFPGHNLLRLLALEARAAAAVAVGVEAG